MITIGEIEKGMIVTVHSWKTINDRSFVGEGMEVVAVSCPFVRLKTSHCGNITLDTREVDLMEVDPLFCE
jgi:hypothetical protein